MKPRYLACIAAVVPFGLIPVAADAGFYSGNELYDVCTAEKGDKGYVESAYQCLAYITGAVDAFNTTREAAKLKSCIPPDVTISQLKDVTVAYLRDNPETRNASASSQVYAATRKAWACPGAKPAAATTTKKKK
jgi:hypothetical protein